MWMRAARWTIAALIGSAMTTIGCGPVFDAGPQGAPVAVRRDVGKDLAPFVADETVMYAFDTSVEMRLRDRLELDHMLRDCQIRVAVMESVVVISGDVTTAAQKMRVGHAVRRVAGMMDVINNLDVRSAH